MRKRRFSVLLVVLLIGAMVTGSNSAVVADENEHATARYIGSSFDAGIANDDKLLVMLKAQGIIPAGASEMEANAALNEFLKSKAISASKLSGQTNHETIQTTMDAADTTAGFLKGKGLKKGQIKGKVASAVAKSYTGPVMEDKILVLLVDFDDYKHGSMAEGESDLFIGDYPESEYGDSVSYYENMMFGDEEFVGPSGEKLISMKKFYEEQSGGSYTVSGTVVDWVTVSNTAEYYGGNELDEEGQPTGGDLEPRDLVLEALTLAAQNTDLTQFDEDQDGVIDHLMVMHAGVGEEAGGGTLGTDAIWSHSWNFDEPTPIEGTTVKAFNYTIQPEDAAAGVCAHEFGHDLGLPDEYDTGYTASGEPVEYWSIMSSGSWAGKIPGTEPTGFSPYAKMYFQSEYDGNWMSGTEMSYQSITKTGTEVLLDQASMKGEKEDVVKINLPEKTRRIVFPYEGNMMYFSGAGDNLRNSMSLQLDLTNASTASIDMMNWYQIEAGYDYLYYQVRELNGDWIDLVPGGISDFSNGWESRSFDLSSYAGKIIEFRAFYFTDGGWVESGVYIDNIQVSIDGIVKTYDAESEQADITFDRFSRNSGVLVGNQYYLLEWRNQTGTDSGLANIKRGSSLMSYDTGLLVWYVDETYTDNFVGMHPGHGYIGIVDADQNVLHWNGKASTASTRYQMHDAAFGLTVAQPLYVSYPEYGITLVDNQNFIKPLFDDSVSYIKPQIAEAGKILPNYGIKIRVLAESDDKTAAKILIYR